MDHLALAQAYFDAWQNVDADAFARCFAPECEVVESDGATRKGLPALQRWFAHWTKIARVLEWTATDCVSQDNRAAVEWTFTYEYQGKTSALVGVSRLDFDEKGRLTHVGEFAAQKERYHPEN